jgi:Flp pilus assembly secretin CpaC
MIFLRRHILASVVAAAMMSSPAPIYADQVSLLSIQSGHSIVLKAEGLTRVAVGDGRIAGVVPIGTSQVVVNAKAPGHTTVFVWAGGRRMAYELTVTEQQLDDLSQMIRSAIGPAPGVQVVTFDHSIVVRGTVTDGAQFQQINDILGRFDPIAKEQGAVFVNAVTIAQNLGMLQREIANIPGASDVRVDPDGRGNVIVSGNATDAITAQAILDRARGLAGPYLASNGQLIDRLNALNNSQIDIKVYVMEVDKTAQSNLGISLQSATFTTGGTYNLGQPSFPVVETPSLPGSGLGFTIQPFFRTITLAPTLNLMMQEGHARLLNSPNLVTSPGKKATFLVGGEIPVVTSTGLGAVNVQYQPYGVQLNVTPDVLGNGSVHSIVAPEVSALDYSNAVVVSGFVIPALTVSQLSTDVITRPGESIILGGLVQRIEKKTVQKIPLLSSIPILGKLFTSTLYQSAQSDVVFIMTPEVVTR